jgi:hypothetical protein
MWTGQGQVEIMELLLEAGADPSLWDKWGTSPLLAALQRTPKYDEEAVARLLRVFAVSSGVFGSGGECCLQIVCKMSSWRRASGGV